MMTTTTRIDYGDGDGEDDDDGDEPDASFYKEMHRLNSRVGSCHPVFVCAKQVDDACRSHHSFIADSKP